MFETLVSTDWALARHRDGPFATERDRYLQHCADQGGTWESLRLRARSILWVAKHMSPDDRGHIDAFRLHEIVHGSVSLATSAPAPTTAVTLVNFARPWLKYLGWWREPPAEPIAFAPALDRFVSWMRDERGLTPCTIDQWRDRTATFLRWCSVIGRDLATLQPQDIDAYFVTYGAQRWSRISAGHIAEMLRVFLRHAASTGACSTTLAGSIQGHRQYALESLPYALSWDDVRRVIAAAGAERDIRDRAILLLLAVYGLRRGEVAALRLDQIDRVAGRLHICHSSVVNRRSTLSCRPWRRLSASTSTTFGRLWRTPKSLSENTRRAHPSPQRPSTPSSTGGCAHSVYRLHILGLTRCAIRAQPSCWPTG